MKSQDLEQDLRRYELSPINDRIEYINHSYNGFTGLDGDEAYAQHLQNLYDSYFIDLRQKIDSLVLTSNVNLLNFLQSKLQLFIEIYDKENKNNQRYVDYILFRNLIIRDETVDRDLVAKNANAKNQYQTMKFYVKMMDVQFSFLEKAIDELTKIYETYKPETNIQKVSKDEIIKETWENTLKNESEILSTLDLTRIFDRDSRTINRWVKEGVITPIDKSRRPHQFNKTDIKKYYLKLRNKNIDK